MPIEVYSLEKRKGLFEKGHNNNSKYGWGFQKGNKIGLGNKSNLGKKQSPETIRKKAESRKDYKHSEETKKKIGLANSIALLGKKQSLETIEKRAIKLRGKKRTNETIKRLIESHSGEKHYRWNPNRNEVRYDRRNDSEYKQWRKKVYKRDIYRCKINNCDCKGRLEAHHILSWKDYPELRYNINNGIILCQFHHPHKRIEEQKLIPFFQRMVEVIK